MPLEQALDASLPLQPDEAYAEEALLQASERLVGGQLGTPDAPHAASERSEGLPGSRTWTPLEDHSRAAHAAPATPDGMQPSQVLFLMRAVHFQASVALHV